MAILMIMEIPGGTTEMYDRVGEALGIQSDDDLPPGLISHAAGVGENSIVITDVWESEEALQRFFAEGATATMQQVGVPAAEPRILPVHNLLGAAARGRASG